MWDRSPPPAPNFKQRRREMLTTSHQEYQDLIEWMTKEKPSQFAVVFDKDEQEWHYSRPSKFVVV